MSYRYLHIDFETYSKRDIKSCGAFEYAADPSTELICMFWKWRDAGRRAFGFGKLPIITGIDSVDCFTKSGKPKKVKVKQYDMMTYGESNLRKLFDQLFDADGQFRNDVKICAWNISFERAVWEHVGHQKLGWPSLEPFGIKPWEDTMAIAKAHTLPGALDDAAKALGVVEQKDKKGKAAMLRISQPKKPSAVDPYERDLDPTKWKVVAKYCRQDVYTEASIGAQLLPLSKIGPIEQEIWELDQHMNHEGVLIDRKSVVPTIKIIEESDLRLNQKFADVVGIPDITISKHQPFTKWLLQKGLIVESVAKPALEELLNGKDLDPTIREAIELKLAGSKSSVKKFYRMEDASRFDHNARYLSQYYGASTGRWAGRLIQLQNLAKGKALSGLFAAAAADGSEFDKELACDLLASALSTGDYDIVDLLWGDPMAAASTGLRSMIIAEPGETLIFADYSSIEARGTAWLAAETRMLDIFARGECVYKDMAGQIYKIADPQKMEKKDSRRDVGKMAILGLGYSMGDAQFERACNAAGIDMDIKFSKSIVDTYRKAYSEIPKTWWDLDEAAVSAVRTPGTEFEARGCSFLKKPGKGTPLYCQLPSGRRLLYFAANVRQERTPWNYLRALVFYQGINSQNPSRMWDWQRMYGGKWTENIVQALSRDIMAEAMLRLHGQGYDLKFTVHDEIVLSAKGTPDPVAVEQIMCEVPKWAKGFPIEAEAEFGTRYRK